MSGRIHILGVGFDAVTLDQAQSRCRDALGARRGESAPGFRIYTPNPEIVLRAAEEPAFAETLERGDLVIPDGIGVIYAARMLGTPLPERVPGIELLYRILRIAASDRRSVYLLGAKPGVAEAAAERIVRDYPGVAVAGTRDGYFSGEDESRVVAEIAAARPDILIVALGAPKQEYFIDRYLAQTGASIGIGVGGALDVISGRVRRAPVLFQKLGMEWLYRGLSQPSRLPRLLKLPFFLIRVRRSSASSRGGN